MTAATIGGMGSEGPLRAEVGRPELVSTGASDRRDARRPHPDRLTMAAAVVIVSLGLTIFLMAGGQEPQASPSQSLAPNSAPETQREPSSASKGDTGPNFEVVAQFDGPILNVPMAATAISTDFDGRLTALDLDSGVVTRTAIRTGAFVKAGKQLVVQTGCGAWQVVEIPEYTLGDQLIGCGSYRPIKQRGADAVFFASLGPDGESEVVMADGDGGVVDTTMADVEPLAYVTASQGRVLIQAADSHLVWFQTRTGESTHYTDGTLIEAGPGGALWSDCETWPSCAVWFGTPEQARVNRFMIESRDGEFLARINDSGSRAVFFLEDETLRIITLETGHAREVENPGIEWSTATWSPDGLWLLDPMGRDVVALNTLNGRTVRFDGVPGDVSPGWIALIADP